MKENTRKKIVFFILIVLVIFIIIFLATLSAQYDYKENENWVTMLAGFWSAAATSVLGFIAIWQNRKYKKLAEDDNQRLEELTIMPECFLDSIIIKDIPGNVIMVPKDVYNYEKCLLSFITVNRPI